MLCSASLRCSRAVAATSQPKSPFAFFGLALAAGSRGFCAGEEVSWGQRGGSVSDTPPPPCGGCAPSRTCAQPGCRGEDVVGSELSPPACPGWARGWDARCGGRKLGAEASRSAQCGFFRANLEAPGTARLFPAPCSPWFPRSQTLFHPPGTAVAGRGALRFLQRAPGPWRPLVPGAKRCNLGLRRGSMWRCPNPHPEHGELGPKQRGTRARGRLPKTQLPAPVLQG